MCLSRKVAFVKRIDCTYRSYHRVRTESWVLKKSWNLSSYFPDLEKVWKRLSLEKMIKSLEFFFFPNLQQVLYKGIFFGFFFKSYSTSSVCLQCTTKKALFLRFKASIDHLFDNLESGGRNYCVGKSLAFSIQKSVWTLLPALCVTSFFRWFFFSQPISPSCSQRWWV